MSLKTLDDFLSEGVELFPPGVDTLTRVTIEDWFGYRKVANNSYFPDWFYRCVKMNYPRYMEILRIEARTAGSEYDWLVTNYEERQVEISDTGSISTTGSVDKQSTNTRVFTAGTAQVTIDSDNDSTTGTVSAQHTGTDTNQMTRNLTHNQTERFEKDGEIIDNAVRTPNLSTVTTGSDESTETTSNSDSRESTTGSTVKNSSSDNTRHGVLQRQAPYDQEYSTLTDQTNIGVTHTVGDDGVDTSDIELTDSSKFMGGFPDLLIKNPTASSDELTQNSNVNLSSNSGTETVTGSSEGDKTNESSRTENKSETGTDTTRTTTTDTQDNLTTINGTDGGTETNTRTANLVDTNTTNMSDTHSGRSETRKSGSDRDVTTIDDASTNNSSTTSSKTGLERTIFTGRNGQSPQLLLSDAVKFIKSTSAWLFFYRQIDKCFMMTFNTDDYEEVE